MNEDEIQNWLEEALVGIEEGDTFNSVCVRRVATEDKCLLISLDDGTEFELTIKKVMK